MPKLLSLLARILAAAPLSLFKSSSSESEPIPLEDLSSRTTKMKFSHSLQFNAVPEWSSRYILYSTLKKLLYDLQKQALEEKENARDLETPSSLDPEAEFVAALDKELVKIDAFYKEKETFFSEQLSALQVEVEDFLNESRLKQDSVDYADDARSVERLETRHSIDDTENLNEDVHQYHPQQDHGDDASIISEDDPLMATVSSVKRLLATSMNLKELFIILSDTRVTLRKKIVVLYTCLTELQLYVSLNKTGFAKILKKFDKTLRCTLRQKYMALLPQNSVVFAADSSRRLEVLISTAVDLYAAVATRGSRDQAEAELRLHVREHVMWERNTVWRDMIGIERKHNAVQEGEISSFSVPVVKLSIIIAIFLILLVVLPFNVREQKNCFALVVVASLLWATEAIPLFVTALFVPLLVVVLGVLRDENGNTMKATDASKYVLGSMWLSVVMLLLGGFTLAAALSKYSVTRLVATAVLLKAGSRPSAVLLALMLVLLVALAVVSNVAAPVLCYLIIQPVLRTLNTSSNFAKSLVLGVAFASNLGGTVLPIALPQNIIAVELMEPTPLWAEWFIVSVPVSVGALLLVWLVLVFSLPDTVKIAPVVSSGERFNRVQYFVVFVSALTIVLWCFANLLSGVFGEIGVISVIPIVLFFGSGVLTSEDWNNFLWTIVALAMGGIALGKAVASSGLLSTVARVIQEHVILGMGLYSVCLVFGFLCLVILTFISHTVSALILLPLVKEIGQTMANGDNDYSNLLVMLNVFLCSVAMGLPTLGFPNVTAICMTDQMGRNYVNVREFITRGVPSSAVGYLVVVTVGYAVMKIIHI